MKVAVVGATGVVGRKMLEVLEERKFPVDELIPVGSARSTGTKLLFRNQMVTTVNGWSALQLKPDLAFFSAGSAVSKELAPAFLDAGCLVIDNSSAWRMYDEIPLIVPEVNAEVLSHEHRLISNPNCSTIQLVMVLKPLAVHFGLERIVISTYQSVTGAGAKGMQQLKNERAGIQAEKAFPHPIDLNIIPQAGEFDDGETTEERKLVMETRKILGLNNLRISATAARVPVFGGHSESVNLEMKMPFSMEVVREVLNNTAGLKLVDVPQSHQYPTPLQAANTDDVFVGRIRRDTSVKNGLNMWIVSDNLRKGAATNAIQIAECLLEKNYLSR